MVYWGFGFLAFINWNKSLLLLHTSFYLLGKRWLRRDWLPIIMGFKSLQELRPKPHQKTGHSVWPTRWGWVDEGAHMVSFIHVTSHVVKAYRACNLNPARGYGKGCLFFIRSTFMKRKPSIRTNKQICLMLLKRFNNCPYTNRVHRHRGPHVTYWPNKSVLKFLLRSQSDDETEKEKRRIQLGVGLAHWCPKWSHRISYNISHGKCALWDKSTQRMDRWPWIVEYFAGYNAVKNWDGRIKMICDIVSFGFIIITGIFRLFPKTFWKRRNNRASAKEIWHQFA